MNKNNEKIHSSQRDLIAFCEILSGKPLPAWQQEIVKALSEPNKAVNSFGAFKPRTPIIVGNCLS